MDDESVWADSWLLGIPVLPASITSKSLFSDTSRREDVSSLIVFLPHFAFKTSLPFLCENLNDSHNCVKTQLSSQKLVTPIRPFGSLCTFSMSRGKDISQGPINGQSIHAIECQVQGM